MVSGGAGVKQTLPKRSPGPTVTHTHPATSRRCARFPRLYFAEECTGAGLTAGTVRHVWCTDHVDFNSVDSVAAFAALRMPDGTTVQPENPAPGMEVPMFELQGMYDALTKQILPMAPSGLPPVPTAHQLTRQDSGAGGALASATGECGMDDLGEGDMGGHVDPLHVSQPEDDDVDTADTAAMDAPFQQAAKVLQLSYMPAQLPCRETQREQIAAFLETAVRGGGLGRALYVAGMPGTGKTATITEVLHELLARRDAGQLPVFDTLQVNAMKLLHPYGLYKRMWDVCARADGLHERANVSVQRAAQLLDARFDKAAPNRRALLVVVDELDYLVTRKQTVLYNLFEWPTRRHSRLIVVGIANTMDLPERLLPKVASRLGMGRAVFPPYSVQDIQAIIAARLAHLPVFKSAALQLAARKVASMSGDVRRALQVCRRAVQFAWNRRHSALAAQRDTGLLSDPAWDSDEDGHANDVIPEAHKVSLQDVIDAAKSLVSSHTVAVLAALPPVPAAVVAALMHVLRTHGDEAPAGAVVLHRARQLAARDPSELFQADVLTDSEFQAALGVLAEQHIIATERMPGTRLPSVRLCVVADDVRVALESREHLVAALGAVDG